MYAHGAPDLATVVPAACPDQLGAFTALSYVGICIWKVARERGYAPRSLPDPIAEERDERFNSLCR